jgi:hypothetical protein
MVAIKKLVYYLIPLIVLVLMVLWQFGPEGLFDGIKEAVDSATDLAPNITVGAEEVSGEKVMLPKEHEDAVRRLVGTIEQMMGSGNSNCFANYGRLPDLEEHGTKIILKEGRIEISRKGQTVGDLQKELRKKMEGFKPCVIAGEREVENFYKNFLKEETCGLGSCDVLEWPYYQKVSSITLIKDEIIIYDGQEGDLVWGSCYWDKEGLDDDCFEEHREFFESNKCS